MGKGPAKARIRRWGIILGSALVHAAVLAVMLLAVRPSPTPTIPPIQLSLIAPFAPVTAKQAPAKIKRVLKAGRVPLVQAALKPALNPPSVRAAAVNASPAGPSPVQGAEAVEDGVRRALGGLLGCQPDRLNGMEPAARAACDARLINAARNAPVIDRVPAEKRAYYDAVVATREALRRGPVQGEAAQAFGKAISGNTSHGGVMAAGYHCGVKFGPGAAAANREAGVKLGFPPCPVQPPKGGSLKEADPALSPP